VDGVLPGGRHPRQIGGMHGVRRPPLPQLFKRPAEVIEDLAVDVLNAAVGRHDGDEAGKGLDDEAEALFAGGRSLSGCVRIPHIPGLCHRSGASSVASPSEAQRRPKCTDGYNVSIVQNPTTSLADDVAVTERTLAAQNGPSILVGHSYGGVVITEAGTDPKVAGLVYIAAFAPDKGESVSALIQNPPPGAPVPPILPPQDGYLFLDRTQFRASFAADVSADAAAFMADSQVPWGLEALNGAVSEPAWKSKPSWYLVSTEDSMIPPDAQRAMSKRAGSTVAEVNGSHAVYVSQPQAVAAIITKAAHGVALATR